MLQVAELGVKDQYFHDLKIVNLTKVKSAPKKVIHGNRILRGLLELTYYSFVICNFL